MSRFAWFATFSLAGCGGIPETVRLEGTVRDGLDVSSGPFAGAEVQLLGEGGERLDQVRTNEAGKLAAEVPSGVVFHLVVGGEGHIPASFTGQSGIQETFEVEPGVLHGVTDDEWTSWTTRFAGCPGLGSPGGAVIAEPRIQELVDDDGEHPTVNAAVAEIWDPKAQEVVATACYLDEASEAYDPDALATGAAGVFAIFGVPEGDYVLSVGLEVLPGQYTWDDTAVHLPEGGVAPRFPAWVHFPLR